MAIPLFILLTAAFSTAAAVNLSKADTLRIGKKIWRNECNGTVAGLTSWNAGENFASLGIGHFIWYPKDTPGPFDESFPKFLDFAAAKGLKLPDFLLAQRSCPWNSRAEFMRATDSAQMRQLREFLAKTVDAQAEFLVHRLQQALPKMLSEATPSEQAHVQQQFDRVASTPNGCYALVDYVNFKGEGVLATERYAGRGWGLLQVLEGISGNSTGQNAVKSFAESARKVLTTRVHNAPPERNEVRWLPGWLNRVNSYAKN